MKQPITLVMMLLLLFSTAASAQQTDETQRPKQKRLSLGVQAMMLHTPDNFVDYGVGWNIRYFITERLAISAQLNSTRSLKYYTPGSTMNRKGFEVPVQLEYHLSPGSKVRPFFAMGGGVTSQHTTIKYKDGQPNAYTYTQAAFLQLGYGMSFEVGKEMTLRTQLFYRYNINSQQHSMGLSIGLDRRRYRK